MISSTNSINIINDRAREVNLLLDNRIRLNQNQDEEEEKVDENGAGANRGLKASNSSLIYLKSSSSNLNVVPLSPNVFIV